MQIYDIFTVCSVSILYDVQNNRSKFQFTDIYTKLPLSIDDKIIAELNECISEYMDNNNKIPSLVGFLGYFVQDSANIYAITLDSMQIFNLYQSTCYLKPLANGGVTLIDENSNMEVAIKVQSEEEYNYISTIVHDACNINDCDFSINGTDRLTCIGQDSEVTNNKIGFTFNQSFYINTIQMVIYRLFMSVCSKFEDNEFE